MNNNNVNEPAAQKFTVKNIALVTFSAGCLTFLVAGLALGSGLLLDTRLGSFPRWTLIMLAGSAPFTLGGVYLIARRTLKRLRDEGERENEENDVDEILE